MRVGITFSAIAHAAVVALLIAGLGLGKPLQTDPVESISVDLVPIEEFANIRRGTLDSDIIDTQTPSMVQDDKPAELAQPTGNTEQDQPTPENAPDPTPVPSINTAPENQPEPAPEPAPPTEPVAAPEPTPVVPAPPRPQPVPEPEPEPAPSPPAEPEVAPAPEPSDTPELVAEPSEAEPVEVAPQPVQRVATLEQKRAEFKKQEDARKAAEAAAAKKAAEAAEAKKQDEAKKAAEAADKKKAEDAKKAADAKKKQEADAEAKRQQQAAAKDADRISDIINNEQSRGGTTGQGGQPTVGKPTGTSARLTRSEMDGLISQIRDQWQLMPSEVDSTVSVRLIVSLNRDGSIAGTPQVVESTASASVTRAAILAVRKAAPYRLAADKYDEWKQIDVTLQP